MARLERAGVRLSDSDHLQLSGGVSVIVSLLLLMLQPAAVVL